MARVQLVATLPQLDYLARGGRVPGIAARAGDWLGVRPVFAMRHGHVRPQLPSHTHDGALRRVLAAWRRSREDGARLHVAALHALAPDDAKWLIEAVYSEIEPTTAFVGEFTTIMVAHTGPGLVGLAWWWETTPA